jgi:outer membrane protein assembly factor BamB
MIRFRLGHSWKRESPVEQAPRDAFALEIDGVNLLPPINDEPLIRVVVGVLEAIAAVSVDGERAGQVSLEDIHGEICFWRLPGSEVEISVIDLRGPSQKPRAAVRIDLGDLTDAAIAASRSFLRDLAKASKVDPADVLAIERRAKSIAGSVRTEVPAQVDDPWTVSVGQEGALGFAIADPEGRTLSWSRRTRAGLPPLLVPGELRLPSGARLKGFPFLQLFGLAKAAMEPGAVIEGQRLDPRLVFTAGLELCYALRARNVALASNPYVESLQIRCTDGLTALRHPVPDTAPASQVPVPRASAGEPVQASGALRRVSLVSKWTRPVAIGEDDGRILLSHGRIAVHSSRSVHAFTTAGATAFRRLSVRGIAVSGTGDSICATEDRLLLYSRNDGSARWFRNHDGAAVGPDLHTFKRALVAQLGSRGIIALDPLTGREIWRLDPARTQRAFVTRVGERMILGTDSGTVFGVDASDGTVRFRVRASLPCVAPPIPLGHHAVTLLNRGEHTALFACSAVGRGDHRPAGTVGFTRELILATPCAPVTLRQRIWLGGGREERGVVVCLGPRGQILWDRAVPCDPATLSLVPFDGGVIASDARGVCVRLLPDGQIQWVMGASGDEIQRRIAPIISRHLLVVPGPVLRVIQPTDGRVLAELELGAHVEDIAVDRRLNIYVYRASGSLEAWSPGALFSIV